MGLAGGRLRHGLVLPMCESVSQKFKPVKQMCKPVFQQAPAVVPAMQIWSNKTEIMIRNRKI